LIDERKIKYSKYIKELNKTIEFEGIDIQSVKFPSFLLIKNLHITCNNQSKAK